MLNTEQYFLGDLMDTFLLLVFFKVNRNYTGYFKERGINPGNSFLKYEKVERANRRLITARSAEAKKGMRGKDVGIHGRSPVDLLLQVLGGDTSLLGCGLLQRIFVWADRWMAWKLQPSR